jgi:hypothetical protein
MRKAAYFCEFDYMADIASAIFIRQSPDFSGLCRFWGLGTNAGSRGVSEPFLEPLQNFPALSRTRRSAGRKKSFV